MLALMMFINKNVKYEFRIFRHIGVVGKVLDILIKNVYIPV